MLISPSDHFALHEVIATDSMDLRRFIDSVTVIADQTGCDVYWRGQCDESWGVRSSLARLTNSPAGLKDVDLKEAESQLVNEAKSWVTSTFAKPANDLEWLALLQHHGIPTRLIDFTPDPLIATFFAVETLDSIEGRLFGIAVPRAEKKLLRADEAGFEIDNVSLGKVVLWKPRPQISPRLAAQKGVFALGKLPSTIPARHVYDPIPNQRLMTRSEVVSVMSIPLYFVDPSRGAKRRAQNIPSCFTAKIHIDKASVREQLSKRSRRGALRPAGSPINHASCYPDVEGMAQNSIYLKRIRGSFR